MNRLHSNVTIEAYEKVGIKRTPSLLFEGIINYTIGQHRKLGIELDGKYFVTKIDAKNNEVVLGKEESLYDDEMLVSNISFVSDEVPRNDFKCKVKIRYKKEEADAEVHMLDDKNAKIIFKEK